MWPKLSPSLSCQTPQSLLGPLSRPFWSHSCSRLQLFLQDLNLRLRASVISARPALSFRLLFFLLGSLSVAELLFSLSLLDPLQLGWCYLCHHHAGLPSPWSPSFQAVATHGPLAYPFQDPGPTLGHLIPLGSPGSGSLYSGPRTFLPPWVLTLHKPVEIP